MVHPAFRNRTPLMLLIFTDARPIALPLSQDAQAAVFDFFR